MRMRTVNPSIWANEDLGAMSGDAVLLFMGLWMLADREGRLKDRPHWISTQIFPYRAVEIATLLDPLIEKGFLARYEVDGVRYLEVVNFHKYQKPHSNEAASKIPPHDFNQRSKLLQPKVEATSANSEIDFPSDSLVSDSLIVGFSESLRAASTSQAPQPPEPRQNPSHSPPTSIDNVLGRELARLQVDAEEHWPKKGAIEQGLDSIREHVGSRADPVAALIEVRRGFEFWTRAVPPEGLPMEALEQWPSLETWARKHLWRDQPRRIRVMPGKAPTAAARDDEEALKQAVQKGLAMSRNGAVRKEA